MASAKRYGCDRRIAAAWRLTVETWPRYQGLITVSLCQKYCTIYRESMSVISVWPETL